MGWRLRTITILGISMLTGCGTLPVPAATERVSSCTQSANIDTVAQSPPEPLEIVLNYVASNLEENAGLKIAGIITGADEPSLIFAVPKKSDELLVIRIKELNITDPSAEIRLTLVLRVFDSSGMNIYVRSITSTLRTDPAQNKVSGIVDMLQAVTKGILKQYAKDPVLRSLIIKYRLGALMRFV